MNGDTNAGLGKHSDKPNGGQSRGTHGARATTVINQALQGTGGLSQQGTRDASPAGARRDRHPSQQGMSTVNGEA